MNLYGVYRGVVTNVTDPENLLRIRALVPQILGPNESAWAWPVVPPGTTTVGLLPGNGVWIMFENGDPSKPVWIGTWKRVS